MTEPSPPNRRPRRREFSSILAFVAVILLLAAPAARAAGPDTVACEAAIAAVEPGTHLPPRLLSAIAMVESGRTDPATGYAGPWPWTINVAGVGQVFDTPAAAIAAVQAAQRAGTQSIDVGCMQINLYFHPQAFADLEQAFDPAANVRYAARFLEALHAQAGDWATAVAYYHSATPDLGTAYALRVANGWPQAERFGLSVGFVAKALTAATLEAEVDPHHILTPEFRARMIEAAAFRHQQETANRSGQPKMATPATTAQTASRNRGKPLTIEALEAEVDPKHVLTPEFRAQMVAAAAFRHQQEQASAPTRPAAATAGAATPRAARVASAW